MDRDRAVEEPERVGLMRNGDPFLFGKVMFKLVTGGVDVGKKIIRQPDETLPVAGHVIDPDARFGQNKTRHQDKGHGGDDEFSFLNLGWLHDAVIHLLLNGCDLRNDLKMRTVMPFVRNTRVDLLAEHVDQPDAQGFILTGKDPLGHSDAVIADLQFELLSLTSQ